MHPLIALCLMSIVLLVPAAQAQDERPPITDSVEQGDYTIHYSLFPSTFLTEQVAATYGIVRARNRAVVNVSVREQQPTGDREHAAQVSGRYTDLMQSKPLAFREIRETGGLYYLAEFRHDNAELLRFDLTVRPEGGRDQRITFTRKLYVER